MSASYNRTWPIFYFILQNFRFGIPSFWRYKFPAIQDGNFLFIEINVSNSALFDIDICITNIYSDACLPGAGNHIPY